MKFLFSFLLMMATALVMQAQQGVGIGTASPDASAVLELSSTTKGLLMPRMTTGQRTTFTTVTKGLSVFDITTNSFWFYDGAAWVELPGANKIWKLDGNAGTNASVNFIGTTDNEPLVFKVNNVRTGYLNSSNTAFGYNALAAVSPANNSNTAFGASALRNNTTGIWNVAVGSGTLLENTIGSHNIGLGVNSLRNNIDGGANIAFGTDALGDNTSGDNNVAVSYGALDRNTTGNSNVGIGRSALFDNTIGSENVALGHVSLANNTSGGNNTAVGYASLIDNTTGHSNVAIGTSALSNNTTESNLVAVGDSALKNNSTGQLNTAVGSKAMYANISGIRNVALGHDAMSNNLGGDYNVGLGNNSLFANTSGTGNVAVGFSTMSVNGSGTYNTAIGHNAEVGSSGLTNATAIGYITSVTVSNTMRFGNTAVTKWGFGRNVTTGALQVGDDATNGNGAYLSAGGTWVNTSDAHKKENFEEVDGKELLQTIMQLPITKWNYKGQVSATHIGPMAQDFYKLFHVGDNNTSISSIDPSGIALRAIQELIKENATLKQQMEELRKNTIDPAALQKMQQQLMQLQEQVKLHSLNRQ